MHRFIVFALFASAITLWGTDKAQAQEIPPGSYQQTCNNISVDRGTLYATCQDLDGNWRNSELREFRRCSSEISNESGNLHCVLANYQPGWRGRAPRGSYLETCRDIEVRGHDLFAHCQERDGDWRDARLDHWNRCSGDISNDNGRLRCTAVGYSGSRRDDDDDDAWRPRGSYRQTCRDIRIAGDDLRATCQTSDGNWRDTKLDDFDRCRGDISNEDGALHCSAYGPPDYDHDRDGDRGGPQGSYQQTCTDIHVRGDDLIARCRARDGRYRDTKLDGFQRCRADITNDNGKLLCSR